MSIWKEREMEILSDTGGHSEIRGGLKSKENIKRWQKLKS